MTTTETPSTSFSWLGNQSLQWFSSMSPTLTKTESSTGSEPMAGEEREKCSNDSGLFYSTADWVNPAAFKMIAVATSDGQTLPYGRVEDIVGHDSVPRNCHTRDSK